MGTIRPRKASALPDRTLILGTHDSMASDYPNSKVLPRPRRYRARGEDSGHAPETKTAQPPEREYDAPGSDRDLRTAGGEKVCPASARSCQLKIVHLVLRCQWL